LVLTGDLTKVDRLLFEKRNGAFYLAIWVEQSCYDVDRKKAISVPVHKIILQTEHGVAIVSHSLDQSGVMQKASLGISRTHAVAVSDFVTILEIDQPRAATITNATRTVQDDDPK
jgi:hypothetical protein